MDFARPVEAVIPGVQGRILAVFAETSAELNLRTVARLARVSPAQASRVLPSLVELGIVERREAPPSALFHFVPENVASQAVMALANSRQALLDEMATAASEIVPPPASVIAYGSFARGDAVGASDVDVVVVRARSVHEDDAVWRAALARWTERVRRLAGNPVELLEIAQQDVSRLLRGRSQLWLDVHRDGIVVFGADLGTLKSRRSA